MRQELRGRLAKFQSFDPDGGHPVLNFTNTLDYRGSEREHDWLDDFTDLLAWSHRVGMLSEPDIDELDRLAAAHPRRAEAALKQARGFREATARVLLAALDGRPPSPEALGAFNGFLVKALSRSALRPGSAQDPAYRLELAAGDNPLEDITLRLALQASGLLTGPSFARLKKCGNPDCGWLFLDTTRNSSRRWCDMSGCGNRAKAKRHYDRKKLAARRSAPGEG